MKDKELIDKGNLECYNNSMQDLQIERNIKCFSTKQAKADKCWTQIQKLLLDTWGIGGIKHLDSRMRANHFLHIIAAFDGEQVMGIVVVEASNVGPSLVEGTFLAVFEKYQNQGVGKMLKVAQIEWAHERKCTLLFGTAIPEYFEKMGLGLQRIPYHENKWLFLVPYTGISIEEFDKI